MMRRPPDLPEALGDDDPRDVRVLRNRSILALFSAEVISNVGSRMTWVALPWFVLVTTGSPTRMGIVFAAEAIPMAILGVPSGLLVQRVGPRTTMIICDSARAPLVALVPLLHEAGALPFGGLLALVFAGGVFSAPYFAAQRLILPEVVGQHERVITQANSVMEGAQRLTGLVGPAAAGAMISAIGAANVLWLDAGSYLVAVGLVLIFTAARERAASAPEMHGVFAGVSFIARDRLLRMIIVEILAVGVFTPLLFAGLPVLAFDRYDRSPVVAGVLASAWSGGALLGAVGAFRAANAASPMRLAAVAAPWVALPIWVLAFDVPVCVAVIALGVSGFAVPFLNAPVFGLLTSRPPEPLRSQVMTAATASEWIVQPLGYALTGPALAVLGLNGVYLLTAAGLSLAMIALAFVLRAADRDATADDQVTDATGTSAR
jgi:MFS family permease